MKSGHAPSSAGGPEALLNARAWRAKKIPGARLRTAATLLVLATVAVAFQQYDGEGTFLTGDWIVAPSVPEWQQMPDAMPGYAFAQSADAFVTTWKTNSASKSIAIPVEVHAGGTLTIFWGDGSTDTATTSGTQSHTYSASGEYQVNMTGGLARINLGASDSTAGKLASIDQWGDIEWSSMEGAFRDASNMKYKATDAPDLSGVTNMNHMFQGASTFNGNISGWDVSAVTDMSSMFRYASDFNQPLNDWSVSAVTDMSYMFSEAFDFNQPLNDWNVSAVTDMSGMFSDSSFNQPLDSWDVSAVTDMSYMFSKASSFNGNISGWDVSKVANMESMFDGAS